MRQLKAEELSIPYLENNIFFDHVYTEQHIYKQASRLIEELDEDKSLIAIGHVGITGDKVVTALKSYIPEYQKQADIVPLSLLLPGAQLLESPL
ncbi:divergent polysaccharide deacetylase family protein [Niallia sp. XMNu-256]|uniref:divergent polysaccharide deacetylase family protein n=1 Tax=Niallia sp. XMNu-256 TaxID=3082444 RepID=UPI0030CA728B